MKAGEHVEETGMLVRDGGSFILQRDAGGQVVLDLHRVPVDHVEKHVRVVGMYVREGLIEVEGVSQA